MINRSLHHSAKIVCHEVDLMQDHSVQQSDMHALNFCFSHCERYMNVQIVVECLLFCILFHFFNFCPLTLPACWV